MPQIVPGKDLRRIFNFKGSTKLLTSRESNGLEYKESFNWSERADYAKTIAAFANCKGGYLIFGVSNSPKKLVGLRSNNFDQLDEAVITGFLNSIFSPEILYEKVSLTIRETNVGLLYIHESTNKPVVSIKDAGSVQEACIYYRYHGKTEKIKFPELQRLITEIKERETKAWQETLKKIARIGIPVSVAKDTKKISEVSYRFTNDPKAKIARLDDTIILKEYNIDYNKLVKTLEGRYSNFVRNRRFTYLLNALKVDPNFFYLRLLEPGNPRSGKKGYYHPRIIKEIDNHYKLKS